MSRTVIINLHALFEGAFRTKPKWGVGTCESCGSHFIICHGDDETTYHKSHAGEKILGEASVRNYCPERLQQRFGSQFIQLAKDLGWYQE